ncbi:hypothetical protein J7M28_11910 [bacterium]|nr:hypothetical protein [bacterium]
MKNIEKVAIILAAISLAISVGFKLTGFQHFVTATGVWRFTMACLGFAIWARLAQQKSPAERE